MHEETYMGDISLVIVFQVKWDKTASSRFIHCFSGRVKDTLTISRCKVISLLQKLLCNGKKGFAISFQYNKMIDKEVLNHPSSGR